MEVLGFLAIETLNSRINVARCARVKVDLSVMQILGSLNGTTADFEACFQALQH